MNLHSSKECINCINWNRFQRYPSLDKPCAKIQDVSPRNTQPPGHTAHTNLQLQLVCPEVPAGSKTLAPKPRQYTKRNHQPCHTNHPQLCHNIWKYRVQKVVALKINSLQICSKRFHNQINPLHQNLQSKVELWLDLEMDASDRISWERQAFPRQILASSKQITYNKAYYSGTGLGGHI